MVLDVRRPAAGKLAWRHRFRAFPSDSFGGDEQHGEANVVVVSARLGEARSGGDASATAMAARPWWGKKNGEQVREGE